MKLFTYRQTQTPLRIQHPYWQCLVLPLFYLVLFTQAQLAHADFRKALTAYQNRDGKTMLKEVQDAVDKKNDDGLILFLSVLELDKWIVRADNSQQLFIAPLDKLLNFQVKSFFILISHIFAISSDEAKMRFAYLYYAYVYEGSDYHHEMRFEDFHKKIQVYSKWTNTEISPVAKLFNEALKLFSNAEKTKKNSSRAMYLLKQALKETDAYLYWGNSGLGRAVSQFYFNKYRQTKKIADLKQTHAWALVELTNNSQAQSVDTLLEMHELGLLHQVDPQMAMLFKNLSPRLQTQNGDSTHSIARKKAKIAQLIQANIKDFALPDLITQHHAINLKNQPVISLRRLVNEGCYPDAWDRIPNAIHTYTLDVYEDGRVNLTLGAQCNEKLTVNKHSQEIFKTISQTQVKLLYENLGNIGLEQLALFTRSNGYSGSEPCTLLSTQYNQAKLCDSVPALYSLTLRNNQHFRTIKHLGVLDKTPELVKAIMLIEKSIPTLEYRCGTEKNNQHYIACVHREKQLSKLTN
jgi:hypothetical protein